MSNERTLVNVIPAMSWGAIFAGTVIISVSTLILSTLGASLGLWNIEPDKGAEFFKTLGISALIWWIITALISTFIGAWVSGRLANSPVRLDAALHGIVAWSLAMLIADYMATVVTGAILSNAFGVISKGAQAVGAGTTKAISNFDMNMLPPNIRQQIQSVIGDTQTEGQGMSYQQAWDQFVPILRKGPQNLTEQDKQKLANIIQQRTNLTQEEAMTRVNEVIENFGEMQKQLQQLGQQAQEVAETTSETAGMATFGGFIVQILSVIAAALGGISGAKSLPSQRI
jgi:hypothetical protein